MPAIGGGDIQQGVVITVTTEGGDAAGKLADDLDRNATSANTAASAYGNLSRGQAQIIGAYEQQARAVRSSGDSLEVQRVALTGLKKGLEEQVASFVSMGDAGKNAANAAGDALGRLKQDLREVAELSKRAAATMPGGDGPAPGPTPTAPQASLTEILGDTSKAAGIEEKTKALDALGLAISDIQGKSPAAVLSTIRAGLAGIEDPAQRAAIATTLLGAAGAKMAAQMNATGGILAKVQGAISQYASALGPLGSILTKLSSWAMPAAAIGGLVALTAASISSAAELEKLHQRTGIATEDLSVLKFAAEQVGMGLDDVAMSMRMFDRHVDEALSGRSKMAVKNFQSIGMSVEDLKTKRPMDLFLQFATGVTAIEDPTTRSAKATELMGRASEKLMPVLMQLAGQGYGNLAKEAAALGLVVSGSTAKAALDFERNMAKIKMSAAGVGNMMMAAVLPALGAISDMFVTGLEDPWTKWLNPLRLIAVVIQTVVAGIATMLGWVAKLSTYLGVIVGYTQDGAGYASEDLTQRSLAAKTKSRPGAYSLLADHDEQLRRSENHTADIVGRIWGMDQGDSPKVGKVDREADTTKAEELALKQTNALRVAHDQLDISRAQAAAAAAVNTLEAQRLEHNVKLLQVQKEMDSQIKGIPKEFDDATKATLTSSYRGIAAQKEAAEMSNYAREREAAVRSANEQLRASQATLAIDQLQVGAAANLSESAKERLEYTVKTAQIANDLQSKLAGIDPQNPNAGALRAGLQADAHAKQQAADVAHLAAVAAIQRAEEATTKGMELEAAASVRSLDAARAGAEAEQLRTRAVMTTAEVQRSTALELQQAQDDYNTKRAAAEAATAAKIQEQAVVARAALERIMAGMGSPEDATAFQVGVQRIQAIQRTADTQRQVDATKQEATLTNIRTKGEQARSRVAADYSFSSSLELLADFQAVAEQLAPVLGIPIDVMVASLRKKLEDSIALLEERTKRTADAIRGSLGSIFDAAISGGKWADAIKNVAQQWRQNMGAAVNDVIQKWVDGLTRTAQGQPQVIGTNRDGSPIYGPPPTAAQQTRAKVTMGAAQVAGAGLSGYSAGQGGGAALASAAAAFISGAMVNIWVGVLAAAASLIGSAVSGQQKRDEYKFGVPGFTSGQAELSTPKNLEPAAVQDMTEKLQTAYDKAWNGFVNIMLKLPGSKIPSNITMNGGHPFQYEPSAHWEEHFQLYLTDTLPKEIAGKFQTGMKNAFTASGMTGKAFDDFWKEAAGLNPQDRLQFWSDMAEGLASFAEAQKRLQTAKDIVGSGALGSSTIATDGSRANTGDSEFIRAVKDQAQPLADFARQMIALTGPDRVAAFKGLAGGINQLTQNLADFLKSVNQAIKDVRQDFTDAKYQHNLELVKDDPNATARLMEARYNEIYNQIANADKLGLTPDQVRSLNNEAIGLLNQIFDLDPTQKASEWWNTQIAALQKATEAALNALGAAATSAVAELINELKPFVDWFLGLPVVLTPDQDILFGPLKQAFDDLAQWIRDHTPGSNTGTPPAGGGGTGGKKPGTDDPPEHIGRGANSTGGNVSTLSTVVTTSDGGQTVVHNHFYGPVMGVDDFMQKAFDYTANELHNNPQVIRSVVGGRG